MTNFILVKGNGSYKQGTACVMSAAVAKYRLSKGESLGSATDELECACPVIRAILIGVNDDPSWKSSEERTELLTPWTDKVIDSRVDLALTIKRAFLLADRSVRVFAPIALKSVELIQEAEHLQSLQAIDSSSAPAVVKQVFGITSSIHSFSKESSFVYHSAHGALNTVMYAGIALRDALNAFTEAEQGYTDRATDEVYAAACAIANSFQAATWTCAQLKSVAGVKPSDIRGILLQALEEALAIR